MLSFLFNSTMLVVAIAFFGLMWVLGRVRKFRSQAQWGAFVCAVIAGCAVAMTFLGDWTRWLLDMVLQMVGAPLALVGVAAFIGVVLIVVDLVDGRPDGMAKSMALVIPTLLLATGGQLGLMGDQFTGAATDAGQTMLMTLIGGV
ncbi:hypothetical protein [Allonocardiopsis opalescens]|uniref:Uncharacterized protein n=1 Tax=Allonocardiopsis opalescens TaxID=1144618 RepID=A0A2T0PSY3_9ACTN|nr:hypothetical protein [Allonocardiopsis opalescens]PRX92014.1 hypothetical protein CLV72_11287 [Allonocardiopsis opalescens]